MAKYIIQGGHRLQGELSMHGAKNSALPILAATLLCENSVIHNCPDLTDVTAACNILSYLGSEVKREENTIIIRSGNGGKCCIPDDLMRQMRSSIVFLGAIVARCGKAKISMPGGCELGPRPIDLHLSSLQKLGLKIEEEHGYLNCTVDGRLKGASITLPFPSVGATENIMLAGCLADGETIISNVAREPEISDLAAFLVSCGAKIELLDSTIRIQGVDRLTDAHHTVIADRIAAATYLCSAVATKGKILLTHVVPAHLSAVLPILEDMGCFVKTTENTIYLKAPDQIYPIRTIRTMPYPGFPTDAQSPLMSVLCLANGTSIFVENIFENRYKQVAELTRMGANIKVEGRIAIVQGVDQLHSARVECTDLRGGAAVVVAALSAQGESEVLKIEHIQRGYENFEQNLSLLGAVVRS